MNDDFKFPESLEPEMPQGFPAQMVELMRRIHGQPDSRAFEWRVLLIDLRRTAEPSVIASAIENYLNEGFSSKIMLADIQRDFLFWAGARLRKPEGE